jgi:hypothetical protein
LVLAIVSRESSYLLSFLKIEISAAIIVIPDAKNNTTSSEDINGPEKTSENHVFPSIMEIVDAGRFMPFGMKDGIGLIPRNEPNMATVGGMLLTVLSSDDAPALFRAEVIAEGRVVEMPAIRILKNMPILATYPVFLILFKVPEAEPRS